MSVDHGNHEQVLPDALFMSVRAGMTVIVKNEVLTGETLAKDWWMGQVLHRSGAARNPEHCNLFQIADVDDGTVRWVNADLVTHILPR